MYYNFYDLSRIPLSHIELSAIASDACESAKDSCAKVTHCPWNQAANRKSKLKRLVWRSVFRKMRERRDQLATKANQIAGRGSRHDELPAPLVQTAFDQPCADSDPRDHLAGIVIGQSRNACHRQCLEAG